MFLKGFTKKNTANFEFKFAIQYKEIQRKKKKENIFVDLKIN